MKIEELKERVMPIAKKVLGNKTPEAVIGIEKEAKGYRVTLEVLEQKVTPPTQDLVGIYEFSFDAQGDLLGYRQTKLKRRSDTFEEEVEEIGKK